MPLSPTRDLFESMLGFQLWIQVPPPGCVRGSPLYDAWTPDNGIGSDRLSMLDAFIQMRSCAQDGPMRPSKPHNIAIKNALLPCFPESTHASLLRAFLDRRSRTPQVHSFGQTFGGFELESKAKSTHDPFLSMAAAMMLCGITWAILRDCMWR